MVILAVVAEQALQAWQRLAPVTRPPSPGEGWGEGLGTPADPHLSAMAIAKESFVKNAKSELCRRPAPHAQKLPQAARDLLAQPALQGIAACEVRAMPKRAESAE